jgi:nicotinamide mononucleotide (NMN) deamidase PncC
METFPHIYSVERGYTRKLAILATGGGMSLANLATVPGSSKILECFYVPYSVEESTAFVLDNGQDASELKQAVSVNAAIALYNAMKTKYPNCQILAITAACTSLRYRRGDNRAFIAFMDANREMQVYRLNLEKLDEVEHSTMTLKELHGRRCFEDKVITDTALALIVDLKNVLATMFECGTLTQV